MAGKWRFNKFQAFWDGVSSAFDLFGTSFECDYKERSSMRKLKNNLSYDFFIVGKDMEVAIEKLKKKK